MKKIIGWAAAGVVGLTLLACSGNPSDGTSTKRESTATAPSSSASAEAKEDGPVIAKLGSKGLEFTDEKIDVAISTPSKYRPSRYYDPVPKGHIGFVLTVTVVNRNDQAIKVSGLQISATVGKEGAEAEPVFDTGAGIKGAPEAAILPGKKATFKVGFTAPTTEAHPTIDLSVTPYDQGGSHTGLFSGTY